MRQVLTGFPVTIEDINFDTKSAFISLQAFPRDANKSRMIISSEKEWKSESQ